jgi:hypothetical protein
MRKLLAFFEIHDEGRRHLGFYKICISDQKHRYWLAPGVCRYILVNIASSMRKLLTIVKIQDGGHFGFLENLHI